MRRRVLTGEDPLLRGLAERKLIGLDLREECARLDRAVEGFRARHGRLPNQLHELVTGQILSALPRDPLGGRFVIDAEGKARNTTLMDVKHARIRKDLRTAIEGFSKVRGHWPATLDDLVDAHIMTQLPAHPIPGASWRYDPVAGEVE
jgi:hypothetical protein